MKTIMTFLLAAVLTAGTYRIEAQPGNAPPPAAALPAVAATVASPAPAAAATTPGISSTSTATMSAASTAATNGLRLTFRAAPLESVLEYLSDAAGFIIVLDTQLHGRVDVWSDRPVTRDEAVDLLNSVLNKNGYAAIRDGR